MFLPVVLHEELIAGRLFLIAIRHLLDLEDSCLRIPRGRQTLPNDVWELLQGRGEHYYRTKARYRRPADMPESAIASGYANLVLSPEDIGREIERIAGATRNEAANALASTSPVVASSTTKEKDP